VATFISLFTVLQLPSLHHTRDRSVLTTSLLLY